MGWHTASLRVRRWARRMDTALHRSGTRPRWDTTPPPAAESYIGWRARWLTDSMWCRTAPGEPGIEIPRGTQGTVTEFVVADRTGARAYRITFDNGARFTTYLPAPWAIELTPSATPSEQARAS